MQDLSQIKVSRLRSRIPPGYNLASAPARTEPTSRQFQIEGINGLITKSIIPISVPRKGLRLKGVHPNPPTSGILSTSKNKPKKPLSTNSTLSKTGNKSPTKPPFHVSKKPILGEISRNVTPVPYQSIQVELRPDSENWHKSSTSLVKPKIPPVTLRLQNQRRPTVLPTVSAASVFNSLQSSPEIVQEDIFYDPEIDSAPCVRRTSPEAVSPCLDSAKPLANRTSIADIEERPRPRSALSLHSGRLDHDTAKLHISKTVRFDPAIIFAGPLVRNSPQSAKITDEATDAISENRPRLGQTLDVQDCVEALRKWKRHDRSKLNQLLEALKQIDFDADEARQVVVSPVQPVSKKEEFVILEAKTLNPRVPSFHSVKEIKTAIQPEAQEKFILQLHTQSTIANKENIPPHPHAYPAVVSTPPKACKPASTPIAAHKRPICDDRGAPGREVDAFEQWYADKQLVEFMRKYPLTGKKAAGTVTPQKLRRETTTSHGKLEGVPPRIGEIGVGVGAGRDMNRNIGLGVDMDTVKVRRRERERNRQACFSGVRSPLVGRHAAVLQQRLEFLLLKEKERKARVLAGGG